MQIREVQTCLRCRESKRRCDKTKPTCSRCHQAGVLCVYDLTHGNAVAKATNSSVSDQISNLDLLSLDALPTAPSESHGHERIVKRRDRACLSCTRCHRLKVKCDKKHPCCSRCGRTGFGRTCIYTHKAQTQSESQSSTSPVVLAGENAETVVATWFLRRRGYSHWRALITRVNASTSILDEI
jgi:hypothetical protein